MNTKLNADEVVQELRKYTYWCGGSHNGSRDIHPKICDEAADLIEYLDAQLIDLEASSNDKEDMYRDRIRELTAQLADAQTRNKRLVTAYDAYDGSALERADGLIESMEKEITDLKAQLSASQARERAAVRRLRYEWDEILPAEYSGTTHHLKTVQPYYDASECGDKTFEIRKDDRGYAKGDILHLYEWTGEKETWRSHYKQVTYILRDAPYVPEGYVCLACRPITRDAAKDAKAEWRGPVAGEGEQDE